MSKQSSDYKKFLCTDYWHGVRKLVMERDGYRCVKCGKEGTLPFHVSGWQMTEPSLGLHVHHLTYINHFEEHLHLEDLQTLCQNCHKLEHKPPPKVKKDKEKKPPRPPKSERTLIRRVLLLTTDQSNYHVRLLCNNVMWSFSKSDTILYGKRIEKKTGRVIYVIRFPRLVWDEVQKLRKRQLKYRKTKHPPYAEE